MHPHHLFAVLALAVPVFASRLGLGCYSEVSSLTAQPDYLFEEPHHCKDKCSEGGYRIAALSGGSQCSCGHELPSDSDKVDDDKCNLKCRGYPGDKCGGNDLFTVLTTAEYSSSDSSSDSNSDSNAKADWGRVIITTATATATPSTAGGGIVVAPTNINESNLPTGILTAPASMISKASSTATSAMVTSAAAITAANADASSTPSSTPNAADSLRAAPVAGILVAGLGLLL